MRRIEAEVVIVGGGPAGSVLGLRLAELGHDVCLIEKQDFPRDHVGESLPPSIEPLLEFVGVKDAVDAAAFPRTRGAWIRWDRPLQFRESPTAGYQVTRSRFDNILLNAARARGVRVLQPARFEPDRVDAKLVADATGRRCITGGAKRAMGSRSLASYAYWEGKPWEDSCSRVAALDNGWIWAAALGDGLSIVATFTDPTSHGAYQALVREANLIPPGGRCGPVRVCDATSWQSETMAGPGFIRVGEAAFTVDPLSSQGVQTAIASALQAAVVVHTMLLRPENTDLAVAFYQARQQAAAARHAFIAANLYAEVAAVRPTEFWRKRADAVQWSEPRSPARISGDFVEPL